MLRLTLEGGELEGLPVGLPTGNIRVLLPPEGSSVVVLPTWNGNEFRYGDGSRPVIRSYTPRRFDPVAHELDVDVVLHEHGAVSAWAAAAAPGAELAVSGTGRGYAIAPDARRFFLGGDESAIPAIGVLLEVLPPDVEVHVAVEVAAPDARLALPAHPGAQVRWVDLPTGATRGDALHAAVAAADLDEGTRVWVAGEAAAVHRIRRHLFEERGIARPSTWVRGYWKSGRAGGDDEDA
jgi:NADPH-dependent ferric siderophore reductase